MECIRTSTGVLLSTLAFSAVTSVNAQDLTPPEEKNKHDSEIMLPLLILGPIGLLILFYGMVKLWMYCSIDMAKVMLEMSVAETPEETRHGQEDGQSGQPRRTGQQGGNQSTDSPV